MTSLTHAAVVISEYQFDSAADPLVLTSSDTQSSTASSSIFAGAGAVLYRNQTDIYNPPDQITRSGLSQLGVRSDISINSLTAALNNDVYFAFTVNPSGGAFMSFSEFQGGVRRSATTSTRGWLLRSSLTGTTDLASDAFISAARSSGLESMSPDTTGTALSPGTNTALDTIDLSGFSSLQNVDVPVTFYVYVNPGNGTSEFGRAVDFDNIRLYGDVDVIPEPGTLALLLGGIVLIARVRSMTLFR